MNDLSLTMAMAERERLLEMNFAITHPPPFGQPPSPQEKQSMDQSFMKKGNPRGSTWEGG
jgi:hypothetical protein